MATKSKSSAKSGKANIKVRDLQPSKDAKGGRKGGGNKSHASRGGRAGHDDGNVRIGNTLI